ncbi:HAD family hydrolase [Streptomyces klenkii]|uniref:HAD family hydrolase n=1 Tax=Streptomyces klenkii TaxID=1420899 RepID=UPI0033A63113
MTTLAVFDLDGTLVDTPRGITETFTAVFTAAGLQAPPAAQIRATIGLPLETAFSQLMAVAPHDEQVAQAVRHYQEAFRDIVLPRAAHLLFPGVTDGLTALRDEGIVLAVATSKFRANADALLAAAGIDSFFHMVVGADEVTHPKPHPASGQMILDKLAVPAERAAMVGDTTHDMLMAHACGMRSIGVTYGVHSEQQLRAVRPTAVAHTFSDVLAHIKASVSPR